MPLRIVEVGAIPENVQQRLASDRPILARDRSNGPSVYVPLAGGTHFLVAGPLPRPGLQPFIAPILVFVLVLTITASAVVGIPLVRRLRKLRHAVAELGDGNWAMRLDTNAEGALGELAESINSTAAQLQGHFEEREALLQTVSHELGTPLARMRFQIEFLEAELKGFEERRRLSALSADLDELDELSTELVAWMEPSHREKRSEEFEIRPVLDSLVELECYQKRADLQIGLDVPHGLCLVADQRQFQRAIENLLRNALRYAQQRIVVEATRDGERVVVEVRDDGPGIMPEQRVRVLEPFVRIDEPWSPSKRGLGLGLAIVRRIVEGHGGTVEVSEAAEGGTRVRTSWP
jgi:signal transduction histidine kinase